MKNTVKVIDLFAGPGGLGEGFSAFRPDNKDLFRIAISIEKETSAHRTLTLRALFRKFDPKNVPESYYAFLRGELGSTPEEQLYKLPELQSALKEAEREAQQLTLGKTSPSEVYRKIRDSLGNEDCILIGGPPCQAYSLVGRSRNYGAKDRAYSASEDHRNFLYKEYLKIIAKFQPMVFVMENVKGMLSAKVQGREIFPSIRSDLQNPCGSVNVNPDKGRKMHKYRIYSFVPKSDSHTLFDDEFSVNNDKLLAPNDFIIRSENYGIPQARHRVILLGIREDIAERMTSLKKLRLNKKTPTVEHCISDLPALRSKLSKSEDSPAKWRNSVKRLDSNTIKLLDNDPLVPRLVFKKLLKNLSGIDNSPTSVGADKGLHRARYNKKLDRSLKEWYRDARLGTAIVNHESRGHIAGDLHRYLYYSTYASQMEKSPNSSNLPKPLWPQHKNFDSGKFADRFRVQLENSPGTTVTSHISKDGHYFIHYDSAQCRSLTVREAARLQTFPDNYYFVGNRTQQYTQVGNAVPPFLALQLAEIVFSIITGD